ncbi:MAG: hypothetical protein IPO65_19330 [Saprospiraceae bacterium]|nr:hypothetical protein [Saprospiraceae bacterium]
MVRELIALGPESRAWIYAADRELTYEGLDIAREMLFPFLEEWTSHSKELMCYGNIFHQRFLGIFVDESLSQPVDALSTLQVVLFNNFLKS